MRDLKINISKKFSDKAITFLIVGASVTVLIFILLLPIMLYFELNEIHNFDIKYDSNFIIGNDYKTIVDEYGEFDLFYGALEAGSARGGYFVKYDSINGQERLYFIEFNSEMIATKTYIGYRPGG